jgi:hypothetical protein
MSDRWTNRSVRLLAREGDPEQVIVQRARALTLRMIEAGWPGPPYDPLWVADAWGVSVVPTADVIDARTVPDPTSNRGVRIEYNPDRPRSRLRFSLAHELAHLLFDDVASAVRSRSAVDRATTDDWQLELLCNLAASEILIPVGSIANTVEVEPNLHDLVELQRRLDTSFEALLLRLVRLTDAPMSVFAASRVSPVERRPIRLDYVIASRSWTGPLPRRGSVPAAGLDDITAVGYTNWAEAIRWGSMAQPASMQGVGVPGFPGHRWPRIVGILLQRQGRRPPQLRIEFGDATAPRGDPPWIIAHIVNDRARAWHGGFAAALRRAFPEAQRHFIETVTAQRQRLGDVVMSDLGDKRYVATLVAQAGYGPSKTPRIRYEPLKATLDALASIALQRHAGVHMPRIGTGQAGGRWAVIRDLIDEELVARGVPVTVYDMPRARDAPQQEELFLDPTS